MFDLSKPVAVVCHDAGATNIILSWLKEKEISNLRAVMRGPAKKLWQEYFPEISLYNDIETAVKECKTIISGTGWATDIEYKARELAKNKKLRSIAIIDHWVNYPERFYRNNIQILPDEFWVSDKYAYIEATKHFPEESIKLINNYYLENQLAKISTYDTVTPHEFLYLLEPIFNTWGREISGEFQALNYFMENIDKLNIPEKINLRLRPHPSESSEKYKEWVAKNINKASITIDDFTPLAESIGKAKWIGGCESYALAVSLAAKKQVFCTLPPWANNCRLPQKEILHIKDL